MRELHALADRTRSPAPIPHQYIGTVVDNTIGLLTTPGNALDGGRRIVTFSETSNWISLMQAVHRSFFSSVHLATEAGLVSLCVERGVPLRSRLRDAAAAPIAKIEQVAGHRPDIQRAVKDLRAVLRTTRPGFDDFLEGALSTVPLPRKVKATWRRFFRALSIVRNKTAHSDPRLTEAERIRLRDGGFTVMISPSGDLGLNPRMYLQVVTFTLNFFDLLCDDANLEKPTTG